MPQQMDKTENQTPLERQKIEIRFEDITQNLAQRDKKVEKNNKKVRDM